MTRDFESKASGENRPSGATYRQDTAHRRQATGSHFQIPVLFRLKNLQPTDISTGSSNTGSSDTGMPTEKPLPPTSLGPSPTGQISTSAETSAPPRTERYAVIKASQPGLVYKRDISSRWTGRSIRSFN